jgi:hypothetical protein
MQKVTYGTVEISVRRATVRDDLNRQVMKAALEAGAPDGAFGFWRLFAELVSQTVKAKGLPFDPTAMAHADKATLDAAYDQFLDLDKELKDRWSEAVTQANKPIDEVGIEAVGDGDPNP